uniref:Uncharacterized protein n=1 Tax=Arcella intermedia TaxID=1963864 RepID=A0A6B2KXZ0_9EUKA
MEGLLKYVDILIQWYHKHRELFVVGLKALKKLLENVRGVLGSNQLTADSKEMLHKFISFAWSNQISHLTETDTTKKNLQNEYLSIYSAIENLTKDASGSKELISVHLISLSLLFGRQKKKDLLKLLTSQQTELMNKLMQLLWSNDDIICDMVLKLLQQSIRITQSNMEGNHGVLVDGLLEMFKEGKQDITSKVLISFIAQFAYDEFPRTAILDTIFRNLDKTSKKNDTEELKEELVILRNNSISVLEEIILCGNGFTDERNSTIGKKIARELLLRLHDQNLGVRIKAAKVFSFLDPSFIIPLLTEKMLSKDERVRSAADESYLAMLNERPSLVFTETIKFILSDKISQTSLTNPSQLLQMDAKQESTRSSEIVDKITRLLPKWASNCNDVHFWKQLITQFLDIQFQNPSSSLIMKFCSTLSPWFSKHFLIVAPLIIEKMENQQMITENIVNDSASKDIQKLLFDSLCPLLILRTMNSEFYSDANDNSLLLKLLSFNAQRAFASIQFEEVRKIATENCARFPLHLSFPEIMEKQNLIDLLSNLSNERNLLKIQIARALVFFICQSLLRFERKINDWFSRLAPHLCGALQMKLDGETELSREIHKLQYGCIDFLAISLSIAITKKVHIQEKIGTLHLKSPPELLDVPETPNSTLLSSIIVENSPPQGSQSTIQMTKVQRKPIIQELSDEPLAEDNTLTEIDQVPDYVLKGIRWNKKHPPNELESQKIICLLNSIINAVKMGDSPLSPQRFAEVLMVPLMNTTSLMTHNYLKGAYLQAVFMLAFKLAEDVSPYAIDLFNISFESAKSPTAEVRLGGLKLLGTLLTNALQTILYNEEQIFKTTTLLDHIQSSDPNQQSRNIASQLLQLFKIQNLPQN